MRARKLTHLGLVVGVLSLLAPSLAWGQNDTCAEAIQLTCPGGGGTSAVFGSTIGATFTDQGTCGTTHSAPDVWYTVAGNGGDITVDTCTGTSFDTKITVWEGSCAALVCVNGNDDFCGLQSSVTWTSVIGTDYYVMVHGFSTATGDFELTVNCELPVELTSFNVE